MRIASLVLAGSVAAAAACVWSAVAAAGPTDCKDCVGGSIVIGGLIHPGVGARKGGGDGTEDLKCADLLVVGLGERKKSWSAFATGDIAAGSCSFSLPPGVGPTSLILKAWPSGKTIETLLLGGSVTPVFHVRKSDVEKFTGKRFAEDRR